MCVRMVFCHNEMCICDVTLQAFGFTLTLTKGSHSVMHFLLRDGGIFHISLFNEMCQMEAKYFKVTIHFGQISVVSPFSQFCLIFFYH